MYPNAHPLTPERLHSANVPSRPTPVPVPEPAPPPPEPVTPDSPDEPHLPSYEDEPPVRTVD